MIRVEECPFGTLDDGTPIRRFVLSNANGLEVHAINYGGIITSLLVPDRCGDPGDVVLGHDVLDGYVQASPYFGAIIGRCANRIAHGRFALDGRTHQLVLNDGSHHLHGGFRGFDKHVWHPTILDHDDAAGVAFFRISPHGEEHYPGTLHVTLTCLLNSANELSFSYEATTDAPTLVNMTQHTYFDLSAGRSPNVLDQVLTLNADFYTPVDPGLIPTGEIRTVDNTPFDFRVPTRIGARIHDVNDQLAHGRGYDHNWVLSGEGFRFAASATDVPSGRTVTIWTSEPGLQFYSGNQLDGTVVGKGQRVYAPLSGFCLETQRYPAAPLYPHFPSTVLRPTEVWRSRTVWKFSWQ